MNFFRNHFVNNHHSTEEYLRLRHLFILIEVRFSSIAFWPTLHDTHSVCPPKKCMGLPLGLLTVPQCCLLIPPPLSFRCLQLCLGAAILSRLCPGSLAIQDLLPCPGVWRSLLLLLPITTLLGPLVVGASVMFVVGRKRGGPMRSVVSVHSF